MMRIAGAVALLLTSAGFHASAFSVSRLASPLATGPAIAARRTASCALHMQGAKLGKQSTAKDVLNFYNTDLSGKTAIVTGANSGIGLETCKALASVGCRIIMACRNVEAGRNAVESEIKSMGEGGYSVPDPDVEVKELDLNDLVSVEKFAENMLLEPRIDFLINNAGIMALKNLEFTKQGFEKQIGVNHFGHFHLTSLLLPKMKVSNQ